MQPLQSTTGYSELSAGTGAPFVSALLVAAGNSTRMGGGNKQFLQLDGAPVLLRSILAFEACALIREIVLAVRSCDVDEVRAMVRRAGVQKVSAVVPGGATRQESVFAAAACASGDCAYFAIHDGARPLVSEKVLEDTLCAAFQCGAAATGVRVKDTVKVVSPDGYITATPDRSTLWAVHTPQVFRKDLYLHAAKTVPDSAAFTDDCRLLEAAGVPVRMVEGSYENIKITTPEDVCIAEGILRGRRQSV